MAGPQRNKPCPCGSGKKYKKCCLIKAIHPGKRAYGEPPLPGVGASPVAGEVVLLCIHTGIHGSYDPAAGRGADPNLLEEGMSNLHFFYSNIDFQRDDGSPGHAHWMGICNECFMRGNGTTRAALIGGDYTWPEEPEHLPPLISPPDETGPMRRNPITDFREYPFLSNFYPAPVVYRGLDFPTVEHAYQAAKCANYDDMLIVQQQATPGRAKRAPRRHNLEIRADWDDVKLDIMDLLLQQKFAIPEIRERLLSTGDEDIIEVNTWGDVFWGVCGNRGENYLGKLLMRIRSNIRSEIG
jgi:ribA/ribD-fused uncharacterized protein